MFTFCNYELTYELVKVTSFLPVDDLNSTFHPQVEGMTLNSLPARHRRRRKAPEAPPLSGQKVGCAGQR